MWIRPPRKVPVVHEHHAATGLVEPGDLLFRFQSPEWPELQHEIIVGEQDIAAARAEIEVAEATRTRMYLSGERVRARRRVERTPRGRLATRRAYQHLGLPYNREKPPQPTLFDQEG